MKTILVTGVASGIGYYIAQQYIEQNYHVIAIDINSILLDNCTKYICDLRNEEEVCNVFNQIQHIDLAINCAGVSATRQEFIHFSASEITQQWQMNFLPTFNAMKYEIKLMQPAKSGKIVNIASITAKIGMKNFLAYSSAKASIVNLTKVAAIENHQYNILINSISPATIDTPMIRRKYNGKLKDYSDIYYTHDCGNVHDIFSIVKMFEENNFMTGNDIVVDGGLTNLFII